MSQLAASVGKTPSRQLSKEVAVAILAESGPEKLYSPMLRGLIRLTVLSPNARQQAPTFPETNDG
jgi:hypothetical protein